jgi:hypothetical protein
VIHQPWPTLGLMFFAYPTPKISANGGEKWASGKIRQKITGGNRRKSWDFAEKPVAQRREKCYNRNHC